MDRRYLGNWNYKYEWNLKDDEWYPCHIYDNTRFKADDGFVTIYTRNGTIMDVQKQRVREMSKEKYLAQKQEDVELLGECAYDYGY